MPVSAISILQVLWALAPIASDIIKSIKKKSPGGNRITKEEWEAILRRNKDASWDKLEQLLNR